MGQALILFTKVPEAGYVKTRLTEGKTGISPEDACGLYSAILLDVFDLIAEVAKSLGAKLYVAYTPQDRGAEIRRLLSNRSAPVSFFAQEGRTTAERIVRAFEVVFAEGQNVSVMVFGDQPGLVKELFAEAFRALLRAYEQNKPHLVLGPTCDGGTYLIGLTSSLHGWMSGAIDCTNTSKAVSRLLIRALASHISYALLKELIDLDELIDLELLLKKGLATYPRTAGVLRSLVINRESAQGSDLSVITPTLNEERTVEKTIHSLRAQKLEPKEIVVVQTSARRYERSGFFKTLCAWGFTVALSFLGVRAGSIEDYIWRVVQ